MCRNRGNYSTDEWAWTVLATGPVSDDIVGHPVERALNNNHPPFTGVPCRCDVVDTGAPGAYCGAHDRAAPYPGPVLRGEST